MTKIKQKQMKRRSEIIEAAIPLMNSIPFDELSVNQICEAAGISVGSFYHYFEKKSDLLVGLLGLIDEHMESQVLPLLEGGDAVDDLERFAHEWAKYVAAHGIERSKLISSVTPANTDLNGQKRSSVVYLEKRIGEGQERGQLHTDLDASALADYFLLALRGVTTDWSRHGASYDLVEKMDGFIGFWLKAVSI